MATKSKSVKDSAAKASAKKLSQNGTPNNGPSGNGAPKKAPAVRVNQYGIPDWRLEQPEFEVREVC